MEGSDGARAGEKKSGIQKGLLEQTDSKTDKKRLELEIEIFVRY